MAKGLSGSARRELVAAVRARYAASAPSVKREILREFAAITGYHRTAVACASARASWASCPRTVGADQATRGERRDD